MIKCIHLKNLIISTLALCGAMIGNSSIRGMQPDFNLPQELKIHHISVKDKEGLSPKGLMASHFLARLLTIACNEGKLTNSSLINPKNEIKQLSKEQKSAPWGTTQLFLIKGPNASFIVKGMVGEEETSNLVNATKIPGLAPYFYSFKNPKNPQFIFPIAYLSYGDQKENKHYISIMPMAPGLSLADLMENFANEPNRITISNLAKAYFDTGAAMATFYRNIQAKIMHGDLHHGNIFYEINDRKVTLIDNERIKSENANIFEDIAFLLMKSLFVVQWTNPNIIRKMNLKEWYSLYVPSFIAGYLSIFSQQDRKKIYNELVSYIKTYISPENNQHWYTDKSILGFSHQEYLDPIFQQLGNSQIFFDIDSQSVHKKDKNKEQKTHLHLAALNGELLIIWPLIVAGANVNARDDIKNTPLHEASYFNHGEVVQALIRAGTEVSPKSDKGETPLDKALFNKSIQAINILKKYDAK